MRGDARPPITGQTRPCPRFWAKKGERKKKQADRPVTKPRQGTRRGSRKLGTPMAPDTDVQPAVRARAGTTARPRRGHARRYSSSYHHQHHHGASEWRMRREAEGRSTLQSLDSSQVSGLLTRSTHSVPGAARRGRCVCLFGTQTLGKMNRRMTSSGPISHGWIAAVDELPEG